MRTQTSLLLALVTALLGLGLRLAIPVAPVDAGYREVVRAYDPAKRP